MGVVVFVHYSIEKSLAMYPLPECNVQPYQATSTYFTISCVQSAELGTSELHSSK